MQLLWHKHRLGYMAIAPKTMPEEGSCGRRYGRMNYCHYFSEDYLTARRRFLEAADAVQASIHTLPLASPALDSQQLSIDIAWLGSSDPSRALIHSSGLHGVEGFAGSAIQLALLEHRPSIPPDGAILLVHALNPYGMAWLRRANENNVDLNRNFVTSDEQRTGASVLYRKLDCFLNPKSPPSADYFYARAAYYALRYGVRHLAQAIAMGQYEYPKGLFYGGNRLESGPTLYRSWLADKLASLNRGFAIDVHTGLGRSGQESLFLSSELIRTDVLAGKLGRELVSDATGSGAGYEIQGGYAGCFDVLPDRAEMHVVTQEFGTFPAVQVLHALREENRWHHYGSGTTLHPAKRRLKEIFAPESRAWRDSVISQGVSFAQAVCEYIFE
jgi:hypothetical protein